MAVVPQSKVVADKCQRYAPLYHNFFNTVAASAGYYNANSYDGNTCELTAFAASHFASSKTIAGKAKAEKERQTINTGIRNTEYFEKQKLADQLTPPPPSPPTNPTGGPKAPDGTNLRGAPDGGLATTPAVAGSAFALADLSSTTLLIIGALVAAAIYFRKG